MKVMITGGAGFIGSNFVHWAIKNRPDWEILNVDKLTYAGNLENLKGLEDNPRYRFVQADICDRNKMNEVMKGIDLVIHFAAESHVDRSILEPAAFVETNVVGTQVLLQAAKDNGVGHFHHVSTDEVFGALELEALDVKFNEKTPYAPHSPYSASKASSDHFVRAYGDTFGLKYTITNCSNNYGPYQFPEKVIPLFIANALENKPLPIYGGGLAVRDYLYVEDHCEAIALVIEKGQSNTTYCVGGNSERNGIQVAETILDLMDKSHHLKTFVGDRPGHDMRYAIDFSKIHNELGWSPKVTFEEGMRKTVDWYLANQNWLKSVINGDYQKYYEENYRSK